MPDYIQQLMMPMLLEAMRAKSAEKRRTKRGEQIGESLNRIKRLQGTHTPFTKEGAQKEITEEYGSLASQGINLPLRTIENKIDLSEFNIPDEIQALYDNNLIGAEKAITMTSQKTGKKEPWTKERAAALFPILEKKLKQQGINTIDELYAVGAYGEFMGKQAIGDLLKGPQLSAFQEKMALIQSILEPQEKYVDTTTGEEKTRTKSVGVDDIEPSDKALLNAMAGLSDKELRAAYGLADLNTPALEWIRIKRAATIQFIVEAKKAYRIRNMKATPEERKEFFANLAEMSKGLLEQNLLLPHQKEVVDWIKETRGNLSKNEVEKQLRESIRNGTLKTQLPLMEEDILLILREVQ